jgi:hypothetical protein
MSDIVPVPAISAGANPAGPGAEGMPRRRGGPEGPGETHAPVLARGRRAEIVGWAPPTIRSWWAVPTRLRVRATGTIAPSATTARRRLPCPDFPQIAGSKARPSGMVRAKAPSRHRGRPNMERQS